MNYTQRYSKLSSIYHSELKEITIPDSSIRIINTPFVSEYSSDGFYNKSDHLIRENFYFTYPIFVPADYTSNKVILLLHGLNERTWDKYLPWAYSLAENTGSYVILFPISFHMNRSPVAWKDPREMSGLMRNLSNEPGENNMSSFANFALSRRLAENPVRFLNSGYQTVCDLQRLISTIKTGSHPVVPAGSRLNIFAYSIGAFLAEIIMIGNPDHLFDDSKLFMFCGGSVFSNMNGVSKLIMDSMAYHTVYKYYMSELEEEIKNKNSFLQMILSGRIGLAFRSMIDISRFRKFREKSLCGMRERISSIGLLKDKVIPANGIVKTLNALSGSSDNPAEIWDFPYNYSHENPFPVIRTAESNHVNTSFDRIINAASSFLE